MSRGAGADRRGDGRAFDVQGHRGARGLRPENTLAGVACALELGVTSIECDVALSVDDAVVLSHHGAVPHSVAGEVGPGSDDRGGHVPVRSLPLAQLRRLDVGDLGRPVGDPDDGPFRSEPGQRMTTLGAVLGLLELYGAGDVRLDVEIKSARHSDPHWDAAHVVRTVLAEIRAHGAVETCRLRSFDTDVQLEAVRQCPDLPRVLLVGTLADHAPTELALDPGVTPEEVVDRAAEIEAAVVAPGRSLMSAELVSVAHARGLPVVPWTINDPDDFARLLAAGVDGICTDRPDLLRTALAEQGVPLPPRHRAPAWLGHGWRVWPAP